MSATMTNHRRQDDDFPEMSRATRLSVAEAKPPFFRTDVPDIFELYLQGFSVETRQTYNCHCCRRFLENYGALVTLDESGQARSLFWSKSEHAPTAYQPSIEILRSVVEQAPIDGVFYDGEEVWGSSDTPDKKRGITWSHFSVGAPQRFRHPLLSASQKMAEVREERGMLIRALAEFPRDAIAKAHQLLQGEQLYRGEKTLGVAKWFLDLHDAVDGEKHKLHKDAKLWRAAALAPPGFCHVRSSMIGTLLEDIVAGMDFEAVKRRFADKMHPLQYQRATAPPSDANIAQAEKIVAELGTKGALARRFARIEDVQAMWAPRKAESEAPAGGVFDHLRGGARKSVSDVTGSQMTWDKFARTVLPTAETIEMLVPGRGNFIALVTATDPTAPPMLQWDREEQRNPVSWYVYHGGASASDFNLRAGSWCAVTAITRLPSTWFESKATHQGDGVILLLEGARDLRHRAGGGFFTECLRSEYHAVRRTLEAYMLSASIVGVEQATASGYDLRKGSPMGATVRVTSNGIRTQYTIDRWD